MNIAKIINGMITETGVGTEENIVYSEPDAMSVVPIPDWALEIRTQNISTGKARRILKWNYETRQFQTIDLGSFVA
jgi:hypothetical protein